MSPVMYWDTKGGWMQCVDKTIGEAIANIRREVRTTHDRRIGPLRVVVLRVVEGHCGGEELVFTQVM